MIGTRLRTTLFVIFAGFSSAADAQGTIAELPLWEMGIGAVGSVAPEYPGSDGYSGGVVPVPYLAYRGRLFEFGGEETFRIIPFRTDRVELGVSIDGASAVDRRDNGLRSALPELDDLSDLDALVEVGPEVIWRVSEFDAFIGQGRGRLELALQTRGVFSLGDGIEHEGSILRPALRYRQNGALQPGSRLDMTVGPIFASEGVQEFFYEVAPGGAGPAFDARGGYIGTELTASFRYPLTDRVRLVGGVGLSYLGGAANRDSPLFEDEVNASAFFGVTYSFYQSKARARRDR